TAVVSEGEIELLRIGPGDHFGEIGMLTGHPSEATLKALVPVTTYELAKGDLAPVLEARPEVSHELCRALPKRQAAGQLIAAAGSEKTWRRSGGAAWSSARLPRLFDPASAEGASHPQPPSSPASPLIPAAARAKPPRRAPTHHCGSVHRHNRTRDLVS